MTAHFPFAAVSGLLAAVLLLWLMQVLVTPQQATIERAQSSALIGFVRLKREEQVQHKERRLPPPPQQHKPLSRPNLDTQASAKTVAPALDMKLDLDLSLNLGSGPFIGAVASTLDRDFIPLTRQPPQYPYQAAQKGLEGWVRISFRVTETGAVKEAVVLESEPKGVFDQAALRAVYRWRFKPRIVDGKAVSGRATQVVEFNLAKE